MKKIVSNVLIVSLQLIIGGLFLIFLFSNKDENKNSVVVKNDNLNKMADAVSEMFVVEEMEASIDESIEVDLITEQQKKALEEEAAKAKAKAEEDAKKKAEEEAKKQQEAEEAARIAAAASSTTSTCDNSVSALQSYAHDLVINSYGWSEADYTALVSLWNAESGWNYRASNSSGAYGIPQALPGSKMQSEGSDYLTNGCAQIRWGLKYIQSTYGSPSSAWSSFSSKGWY